MLLKEKNGSQTCGSMLLAVMKLFKFLKQVVMQGVSKWDDLQKVPINSDVLVK